MKLSLNYLKYVLTEINKTKAAWQDYINTEITKMRDKDHLYLTIEQKTKIIITRDQSLEYHKKLQGLYEILSDSRINKDFIGQL